LKQILQNFKTGEILVEDVPAPIVQPGCVVVQNVSSLISSGTEGGTVRLGKMSLIGKARARPEQVKKVFKAIQSEGVVGTISAVRNTLDVPIPLGYSCAGVVHQVGEGVDDLKIGDRVACGGGGLAFHAGVVVVPRNLCVAIPEGVSFDHAAFTTVGSIATQGIRIGQCQLGESVVIIGLGLIGLLTAQILKAAGCKVIGVDISTSRCNWAESNNICKAIPRGNENIENQILEATKGYGADKVIVTAAVNTNDPIVLAGKIARYKGVVVVVGRTVMDAPRETFLFKELELKTSLAYGPGTGDDTYEREGYDYPIGYVRWTENRNMQCFLDLVKDKAIDLELLISRRFPVKEGKQAFEIVTKSPEECVGVVLNYDDNDKTTERVIPQVTTSRNAANNSKQGLNRVAVIGAGSFATNIMLPLLHKRKDVSISALVSSTGFKATGLAKKYDIPMVTSDVQEIFNSQEIDCVFILTRHGTHAPFAAQALRSGKHVFVEKPLAMKQEQLDEVVNAQQESGRILMVGFNRRFSPLAIKMKEYFKDRVEPMVVNFRGNVGYRPPEHWLHDTENGGGVIIGEACHYIDFCRWLVGSPISFVDTYSVGRSKTSMISEDNCIINLGFDDGSLATVTYLSNGSTGFGREICEAFAEGKTALWKDFEYLKLNNNRMIPKYYKKVIPDKGFSHEVSAFFESILHDQSSFTQWYIEHTNSSWATIKANSGLKQNQACS
jgi:predicted dehydrogenase/threonine dehydrogenase-like Zn-dependent dehydrogenase